MRRAESGPLQDRLLPCHGEGRIFSLHALASLAISKMAREEHLRRDNGKSWVKTN